jgi:hypothetical protein
MRHSREGGTPSRSGYASPESGSRTRAPMCVCSESPSDTGMGTPARAIHDPATGARIYRSAGPPGEGARGTLRGSRSTAVRRPGDLRPRPASGGAAGQRGRMLPAARRPLADSSAAVPGHVAGVEPLAATVSGTRSRPSPATTVSSCPTSMATATPRSRPPATTSARWPPTSAPSGRTSGSNASRRAGMTAMRAWRESRQGPWERRRPARGHGQAQGGRRLRLSEDHDGRPDVLADGQDVAMGVHSDRGTRAGRVVALLVGTEDARSWVSGVFALLVSGVYAAFHRPDLGAGCRTRPPLFLADQRRPACAYVPCRPSDTASPRCSCRSGARGVWLSGH